MKKITITVVAVLLLTACSDDNTNPDNNWHAKACLVQEHTKIKRYDQFGGKYNTTTYWCENSDLQIIDIWFSN